MTDLVELLRSVTRSRVQGRVVTLDNSTVVVRVGGRVRNIPRTSLALKPGDRVNIQGNSIVGKRKPPPTGATFVV